MAEETTVKKTCRKRTCSTRRKVKNSDLKPEMSYLQLKDNIISSFLPRHYDVNPAVTNVSKKELSLSKTIKYKPNR